ncbi:ABC transporter transmembrane domain-containing protein, partial [Bacillus cereus]|uniref:ABC transporter transmembrane domain-containing protein n=1 Tax=Bacillus cereus TaxID=1396 RepID=UPI00123A0833
MRKIKWLPQIYLRLKAFKQKTMIIVLLTVLGAILGAIPPIIIGKIIDYLTLNLDVKMLMLQVLCLFLVQVIQEIIITYRQYFASIISLGVCKDLRIDTLLSVTKKEIDFFYKTPRGSVIQIITDDINEIQKFSLEVVPKFFHEICLALIAIAIISYIHWPLALIGIFIYSSYLIPLKYFGKKQRKVSSDLREHKTMVRQKTLENLELFKLIKILGYEEREKERVGSLHAKWSDLIRKYYITSN